MMMILVIVLVGWLSGQGVLAAASSSTTATPPPPGTMFSAALAHQPSYGDETLWMRKRTNGDDAGAEHVGASSSSSKPAKRRYHYKSEATLARVRENAAIAREARKGKPRVFKSAESRARSFANLRPFAKGQNGTRRQTGWKHKQHQYKTQEHRDRALRNLGRGRGGEKAVDAAIGRAKVSTAAIVRSSSSSGAGHQENVPVAQPTDHHTNSASSPPQTKAPIPFYDFFEMENAQANNNNGGNSKKASL